MMARLLQPKCLQAGPRTHVCRIIHWVLLTTILLSTVPSQNEWFSLEIKSLAAMLKSSVTTSTFLERRVSYASFYSLWERLMQNSTFLYPKLLKFYCVELMWQEWQPCFTSNQLFWVPLVGWLWITDLLWVLLIGCGSVKIVLFEAAGFKRKFFWFMLQVGAEMFLATFKTQHSSRWERSSFLFAFADQIVFVKITKEKKILSWHFSQSNNLTCDHYGRTFHCNYLKLNRNLVFPHMYLNLEGWGMVDINVLDFLTFLSVEVVAAEKWPVWGNV